LFFLPVARLCLFRRFGCEGNGAAGREEQAQTPISVTPATDCQVSWEYLSFCIEKARNYRDTGSSVPYYELAGLFGSPPRNVPKRLLTAGNPQLAFRSRDQDPVLHRRSRSRIIGGKKIQLRFELNRATLYSFSFK